MKKHLTIKTFAVVAAWVTLGALMIGCATPTAAPQPTTAQPAATTAPTTTATLKGDVVRGGVLYDTWWEVIEAKAPTGDHPLWKTQTTNTRKGPDTWRCKECHGWDYKGKDGADGSGSHKTGFVGLAGVKDKPAADVVARLQGKPNADHDFAKLMKEQDLIDLALFITQGQVDPATMINADKSAKGGDAAAGKTQYDKVCANCHGANGNAINFGTLAAPEVIGHLASDNPWEFIHKVRVGQPGWPMPAGITNEWKPQDYVNVLAPQCAAAGCTTRGGT